MVEKRKKRKMQQKQKQKQTVKQSVIINLQKRRASAPSAGKSQYRNAPPTIQFYPMPQYTPTFNQEMFNQKLETLKADILQKIPKEKIPEQIPVPLGVFNPYREVPMTAMLNKPTDPIFPTPTLSSFKPVETEPEETEPEEVKPTRRGRGRPVGSTNRPKEVIRQEREEKMLRRRFKE
jgi:hypothetical protein